MIAASEPHAGEPLPIADMASHLAGHRPEDRASDALASVLLKEYGYRAREIAAGLDAALAQVRAGIRAAASDHPVALAIGRGRDLAACAVLLFAAGHAAGWLA